MQPNTGLNLSCSPGLRRNALAPGSWRGPARTQVNPMPLGGSRLQILWLQAGAFGNSGEHLRPDFLVVVECEYEVGPGGPRQDAVGATFALDGPADT